MKLNIEIGLGTFEIHSEVSVNATVNGFGTSSDTFLWGILALQCQVNAQNNMTDEICANRHTVIWAASFCYILLSLTLVCVSGITAVEMLSSTPVVHAFLLLCLYIGSILCIVVTYVLFEVKLRPVFSNPKSWGAHDQHIHTTFAGIDSYRAIPTDATYTVRGIYPIGGVILLMSLGLLVISLVCFVIKYKRSLQEKSYAFSNASEFEHKKSVLVPHGIVQEVPDDPNVMLKSRRFDAFSLLKMKSN